MVFHWPKGFIPLKLQPIRFFNFHHEVSPIISLDNIASSIIIKKTPQQSSLFFEQLIKSFQWQSQKVLEIKNWTIYHAFNPSNHQNLPSNQLAFKRDQKRCHIATFCRKSDRSFQILLPPKLKTKHYLFTPHCKLVASSINLHKFLGIQQN